MTLEVVYLSISKPRVGGEWVPLKMTAPTWTPSALDTVGTGNYLERLSQPNPISLSVGELPSDECAYRVYLPYVSADIELVPTGCPCGWFDNAGWMLGFWS